MHILHVVNQTDRTQPNTLIIANCDVVKCRVAAESHIANVHILRTISKSQLWIALIIFFLLIYFLYSVIRSMKMHIRHM